MGGDVEVLPQRVAEAAVPVGEARGDVGGGCGDDIVVQIQDPIDDGAAPGGAFWQFLARYEQPGDHPRSVRAQPRSDRNGEGRFTHGRRRPYLARARAGGWRSAPGWIPRPG